MMPLRGEFRVPQFVAAAVAIIFFVQILWILHNGSQLPITISRTQAQQSVANDSPQKAPLFKEKTFFPRKIWQTSKEGPAGMDSGDREAIKTWTKLNQKWRYESVTQFSAESYIRERFSDRPEIIEVFLDLQDPILRADMIRYLVLLGDGGLYSDLDTRSLKPIEDWIPTEYQTNASVVIGVEYDRLDGDRWLDWTLDLQFTTWAILAKPGHPLLELTVQKVIKGLKDLALGQGKTISGVKASLLEVLDTTGPAIFTRSVFELLSETTGTNFTWTNVTNLQEPWLVDDILILPITAFGCGQGHSNAGGPDDPTALVQHLFKGSWKQDHSQEHHEDREEAREKQAEEALAQQQKEEEESRQVQMEKEKEGYQLDQQEAERLSQEQNNQQ